MERDIVYGQTFEECSILGRHEMRAVALLDSRNPERGVMVTYSGGHICSSMERMIFNEPRRVVFRLVCAVDGGETEFREVDAFPFDLSECEVVLERTTRAGCPIDYVRQSQAWKMWLMYVPPRFSFLLLFYFVMGTVLNCINGARGLESVPHSKQLIQTVYLFRYLCSCTASLCPKQNPMKTEEYEEV